jgi:hypothetical protein
MRGLAAVAATLTLLAPIAAKADTQECVAAAEKAQELRIARRLREARTELLRCVREECPRLVASDCGTWLAQIEATIPRIVVRATDPSGAAVRVLRVEADGAPIAESADQPIPLDPGDHVLTFIWRDAPPVEKRVTLATGRTEEVVVAFHAASPEPAIATSPPSPEPPAPRTGSGVPALTLALLGVGVVGVGLFTVFAVKGTNELDAYDRCKPSCDRSEVEGTRTRFIIGDVALGVGVVALGAATFLFFRERSSPRPARVQIGPRGLTF